MKTHIDDMTNRIVIRLSGSDMEKIEGYVRLKVARSNADFVRTATLRAIWEIENNQDEREGNKNEGGRQTYY